MKTANKFEIFTKQFIENGEYIISVFNDNCSTFLLQNLNNRINKIQFFNQNFSNLDSQKRKLVKLAQNGIKLEFYLKYDNEFSIFLESVGTVFYIKD